MTTYLSRTEVAARIGVKVPTLARYNLPAPDAVIGTTGRGTKGWLPETIDAWDAARPGSGNWGASRFWARLHFDGSGCVKFPSSPLNGQLAVVTSRHG